jgi:hypothetical protein
MNAFFLPFLIVSAMAFGAIVLSCFTLLYARGLSRGRARAVAAQRRAEELVETIEARLQSLSADMDDWKHQPAPAAGLPKPSFNLSKRTQALRMHRRGDSAEQIAAALEIPRQEVDLLLKVHQIVISNI